MRHKNWMIVLWVASFPMTWQTRLNFEGQFRPGPYNVDPHIWVYTREFAERFGMPMEWADPDLKGVEAAAWRKTRTGYVTCGWGGKKDACKEEEGEVLELYFDTRVVPEGILVQSSGSDQISLMVTRIDDLTAVQANRDMAKASNEPQYFCEGIAA